MLRIKRRHFFSDKNKLNPNEQNPYKMSGSSPMLLVHSDRILLTRSQSTPVAVGFELTV